MSNADKVAVGVAIIAGLALLTVATGGVSAVLGAMASTAANGVSKAMQVTGKYVTENAVDAVVDTVYLKCILM